MTDGNKINAYIRCQIKMNGLLEQSKTAYKFDNIKETLKLIPVLCDNGRTVTFTKPSVHSKKDGKILLIGLQITSH